MCIKKYPQHTRTCSKFLFVVGCCLYKFVPDKINVIWGALLLSWVSLATWWWLSLAFFSENLAQLILTKYCRGSAIGNIFLWIAMHCTAASAIPIPALFERMNLWVHVGFSVGQDNAVIWRSYFLKPARLLLEYLHPQQSDIFCSAALSSAGSAMETGTFCSSCVASLDCIVCSQPEHLLRGSRIVS